MLPYCPECGTEYEAGATECIDCRVSLESGVPAPPVTASVDAGGEGRFVAAWVFRGVHAQRQAELAREALAEEGIPSTLTGDVATEKVEADAVQLLVRAEQLGCASAIIRDLPESEVEQPQAPHGDPGPGAASQA